MSYQRLLEDEIACLRSLNAELLAACEAAKQPHEIVWLSTPTRILIDAAIAKAKEFKSLAIRQDSQQGV